MGESYNGESYNKDIVNEFANNFDNITENNIGEEDTIKDSLNDNEPFEESVENISKNLEEKLMPEKQEKETNESIINKNICDIDRLPKKPNNIEQSKENSVNFVNGKIQWLLKSPSKLYDNFYQDKREVIEKFTPGGHLPFESWAKELIDCIFEKSELPPSFIDITLYS